MSEFSFGKPKRLLNAGDFTPVFNKADIKVSHQHILFLARKNHGIESRLGLVIAKKNVRLAVQRNRIKRIIREYFRLHPVSQEIDIIVLARKGLGTLDNATLHQLIDQQWRRLEKKLAKLDCDKEV